MSVYNGGTWKEVIVAYTYNEASASWKQVQDIHVYRNAQWDKVHDTADLYVITSPTINSLIKAIVGTPLANVFYWGTYVDGRALGNIDNSFFPELSSADSDILQAYRLNPSSVTADERNWIEFQIIPYATINAPPP